jgi:hypothetical protein
MPPIDPALLRDVQLQLEAARAEREQLTDTIAARNAELAHIDADIQRLAGVGNRAAAEERRAARDAVLARRGEITGRLGDIDDRMREIVGRLGPAADPCDADPAFPLLLLPVRLETRYTPDGTALRVRMFPDEVHIDRLDRGLSDPEQQAGRAYWTAVWRADEAGADTAWRALVDQVGRERALWTSVTLTPENLAARQTDAAPAFAEVGPRTNAAAVARLLPDSFTVVALQAGQRSAQTGQPIAPAVRVGIFANDGAPLTTVNGVQVSAGAEWIADYAEAERVGMAVTVPLQRAGAPVEQLFVFGVRRSIDPAKLPAELEALLQSHRCTRGLAFVPQGAPTNNTESTRPATYRRAPIAAPPRDPVPPPEPGSNAALVAAALGVSPAALAPCAHAADREQPLARAMNVALWGPTWGGFLDKVNVVTRDGASLSDAMRERTRGFHRDYVRGRGPLPVVRVGNQPYGVLPVSSLEGRWRSTDDLEEKLVPLLGRLRARWRTCLPGVPRVGGGAIDETLRELLGMSPVSVSLRVREVLSDDLVSTAATLTGTPANDADVERLVDELIWEEFIANASLVRRTGSLASRSRPLALPMVDEKTDASAITKLLNGETPTIASVLQALVALAWDRAKTEVEQSSGHGRLADIVQAATALSPEGKERVLALAGRSQRDPASFYAEAERVTQAAGIATTPSLAEYQPVAAVRSSFGELALSSTNPESRASLGIFGTAEWLHASGRLAELRDALTELARELTPPVENGKSRLLFAETLDIASHRLDAWLTGVVERRRQSLRERQPTGLTVGAYGWLENISPARGDRGDGGYVHAPSLAHAATAGILRSAYLAHNDTADGGGAFGIDLTSARVRTAMRLLEGIRQGQPLSALLGYGIERRLHEHQLDRLVLTLRTIAPLRQGKLTDRGESTRLGAIEALAPANVVDGLQLIEMYQGNVTDWSAADIRGKLNARPTNNPYLTGPWPALTDPEWAHVTAAIEEAAAACDAVGDLLMAESIHQLVQGNVSRASAALDTAGSGDVPPAEPEVVASRIGSVPLTHRVLLVAGGGAGWSAAQPRAKAEPRLEAWCAARLGDPATIVVGADAAGTLLTVAESGLSALDLVYDSGNRAVFEQRLRTTLPALPAESALFITREAGWPAGRRAVGEVFELAAAIRTTLAGSRPATALDLAVPNAEATREIAAAEVAAVRGRVQEASDTLAVRADGLEALLASGAPEAAIREALNGLAAYGAAMPAVAGGPLGAMAEATLAEARRRVEAADSALASAPTPDSVVAAGQAVFGEGFWTVPAVAAPAGSDAWQAALAGGSVTAPTADIRRYLADAAAVRDGVRRYADLLLLAEAIGSAPALRAVQVTGVGGTPPPSRWIGGTLAENEPTPGLPVSSAVLDTAGPYDGAGETVALVVDQWVDVLPLRERRGSGADAPIDERATTGISFNAAAASARAPQAMLLAVSPDGARWSSDAVLDVLRDVVDLAKIRGVTLERTNGVARVLPAIYQRSWSLQGEQVLDIRYVAERIRDTAAIAAYMKEERS